MSLYNQRVDRFDTGPDKGADHKQCEQLLKAKSRRKGLILLAVIDRRVLLHVVLLDIVELLRDLLDIFLAPQLGKRRRHTLAENIIGKQAIVVLFQLFELFLCYFRPQELCVAVKLTNFLFQKNNRDE